ncbi:15055_t:CDS:2, partial [Cetraspora pellucida]
VYDDEYDEIDDYDESDDKNMNEDVNKDDDYDDENEGEDVDEDVDEDIDEDYDEDIDEEVDEDDNKDNKAKERMKLEKKLIDYFVSRFKAINADNKWKLSSSRFVEDVLYDWAVAHHSEPLAHSFILDTDCQEVMDRFSLEEKGRKIDILLKLCNNSREILASEVVRTGDIHDRKYLGDRMKQLKLIKDIFNLIIKSLSPITIGNYKSLCTVGIQLF